MMNRYTRIIIRLRRKKDKENNIFDDIKNHSIQVIDF